MADISSGIANGAVAVTLSDTADIPPTLGLYIGANGDVKVTMSDGSVAVFVAVPIGAVLPVCVTRVWSTGTGASSILALYA